MNDNNIARKPLLLAFLTGLCANASLAALTVGQVAFSAFPIIAFALALYLLYQQYVEGPMEGATPICSAALFVVGALGYSSFLRVQHPEIGSNLIPVLVCLGLVIWVATKLGIGRKTAES